MSSQQQVYQYFVEGRCEKTLVKTLKQLNFIKSGKITIHNMIQDKVSTRILVQIKPNTTIVMIFDTDTSNPEILNGNIKLFRNYQPRVRKVVLIPQVQNLEDELVKACALTTIKDLLNSRSQSDFKHDFISCQNLDDVLKRSLDIQVLWSSSPKGPFSQFTNDAHEIKKIPRIAKR